MTRGRIALVLVCTLVALGTLRAGFAVAAPLGEAAPVSEGGSSEAAAVEAAVEDGSAESDSEEEEEEEVVAGQTIEAPENPKRHRKHHRASSSAGAVGPSAEGSTGAEEQTEAAETGSTQSGGSLGSLSIGGEGGGSEALDVPISLLPVYQACGTEYGISWEVLAAINKVETNFGANLGPSSAGAEGWMQFLPSSWKEWGIDADGDGKAQTDDPVDAICSAARYLAASGGESDIYDAVLAYNHADWYVREVLGYAREYERVPANLINSLTAMAEGTTTPVAGEARGARVRAVLDGTVTKTGLAAGLGRYVVVRDAYGDRFVYSGLGRVTVRQGEEVAAGETVARAGASTIGFSIKPDGGTRIDPAELLEIWQEGGVSGVYGIAAGEGHSARTGALLLSADQLGSRVLSDSRLDLPRCLRSAIGAGEVQRQALAALEYLAGRGFEIGVSAATCDSSAGFAIQIESIDGVAVKGHQGHGSAAAAVVRAALEMDGSLAPQRVVSATGLPGSDSEDGASTIELDYSPPQKARLVDGKAVAPTGAPTAVQEMIAAANQISDEPYVWGGGHGSWVSAGYDCSGSVSYVLHAAGMLSTPLTSGDLERWGESGSGRWVTVYANAEHTYAVIAGLRWDTVGDLSGSGPRWHEEDPYPAGFTIRHPRGY